MAALKNDPNRRDAKSDHTIPPPLTRVMREYEELAKGYEMGLLRSLDDADSDESHDQRVRQREQVRQQACHLALTELSNSYSRKQIRRSLDAAESLAKTAEEELHSGMNTNAMGTDSSLESIHNGHFRLYSTELFDMLDQPTDLRFGTLRFFSSSASTATSENTAGNGYIAIEMALNSSFFVADSTETMPFHSFSMPEAPSLRNRGILSRKPEDGGAFPNYDSWLLFTFLGNGCLKLEVPIEMCADVYGGSLRGRENEEVTFWGVFVEDETAS